MFEEIETDMGTVGMKEGIPPISINISHKFLQKYYHAEFSF